MKPPLKKGEKGDAWKYVKKAGAASPDIYSHPSTLTLLFAFRHLIQYLGTRGEAKDARER